MEFSVINTSLSNQNIKPTQDISEYERLIAKDLQALSDKSIPVSSCPCCGSTKFQKSFEKLNWTYNQCSQCRTLFTENCLSAESIRTFFTTSEARRHWFDKIWNQTGPYRKSNIIEPLLSWVEQTLLDTFEGRKDLRIADLFPHNWGIAEVWSENSYSFDYSILSPMYPGDLAPAFNKDVSVKSVERAESLFDGILLFDVLGRSADFDKLFSTVAENLKPGGLCFGTTLLSTGFDVMVLGKHSNLIYPPDRFRMPSFEGIEALVKKYPLEIVEFSTPGVLDVQNVSKALDSGITFGNSWMEYAFTKRRSPEMEASFQEFLQTNRLSSHGRFALRKT